MEMQEVEFLVVTFAADPFEHDKVQRVWIAHGAVETQRLRPGRLEFGRCARIAAGKQGNFMSERYEFLRQPGNAPLRAAIQYGWNSLRQRGNLRESHLCVSCR